MQHVLYRKALATTQSFVSLAWRPVPWHLHPWDLDCTLPPWPGRIAEKETEKARNKKAGVSVGDQLGIKTVAQEVIDAKLAAEAMQEMRNMIDMRFGPGTFKSILDLRAKKIREQKEAEAEARRIKRQKQKEMEDTIKNGLIVFAVLGCAVGLFVFLFAVLI